MPNDKKQKLIELRKKKSEQRKQSEEKKHSEFLSAVNNLAELFDESSKDNIQAIDALMNKLGEFSQFADHISRIEQAIEKIPKTDKVEITNLSQIAKMQQEVDLSEVTKAIESLTEEVKNQTPSSEVMVANQKADEYIPFRRVIQVNGRLLFDDDRMKVNVIGGGGGSTASVGRTSPYNNSEGKQVYPYENLAIKITKSGTDTFVAEAAPGSSYSDAVWRIQKITSTGNVTWKDGDDAFDNTATDITIGSFS